MMGFEIMKVCALLLLIVVLGLALFPPALSAGPPFFTDDPAPLAFRQWEFYVASQDFRTKTGLSGTAPHFELNYGASSNLMLHVITPLNYSKPRGAGAQYGFGDIELGFKYRFVKEKGAMPEVGTFPHLEVPTGSRNALLVPIQAVRTTGQLTVLFVVDSGSKARFRLVKTAPCDADRVEVLSGMEPGDRIVSPIPEALSDGVLLEDRS